MTSNASDKLYTAKDIEKYLGINANTLYHWVQVRKLVKPAIEGYGRGKAHKFDLENMATLMLTKVLQALKIELWILEKLYPTIISPHDSKTSKNLWREYKKELKRYEMDGFYFVIGLDMEGKRTFNIMGVSEIYAVFSKMKQGKEILEYTKVGGEKIQKRILGHLVIDLVGIIRELEERLGRKF